MNEKPFEEKQFKDLDSIALFMQAINESKKNEWNSGLH